MNDYEGWYNGNGWHDAIFEDGDGVGGGNEFAHGYGDNGTGYGSGWGNGDENIDGTGWSFQYFEYFKSQN